MKHLMSRIVALAVIMTFIAGLTDSVYAGDKLSTTKTHIKFFSTTPVEDIESNNFNSTATIDVNTGEVVFVVPMQSFEFEKSLMQRHFNQKKFLNTKDFPRARYVATITNIEEIDFLNDGTHIAHVQGEMTIRGVTNPVQEQAEIKVANGVVAVNSVFDIVLADYGIEFTGGRPSKNVAKTVQVTVIAEFESE
ncbi:MAG: YceI family protein [Cyclonatronaceae bacterium]